MGFAFMSNIVLFGGSFDPVHEGHLAVARQMISRFGAEKVWMIPTKVSPLKQGRKVASDEDRLTMLRLATGNEPKIGVSDFELLRGGVSYTIDTLRAWRDGHPKDDLIFAAGMDSLLSLHRWRDWEGILSLCRFVTFLRPGYDRRPSATELNLPLPYAKRLLGDLVEGEQWDVSSGEIRARVARGQSLIGLVPRVVEDYIFTHHLYDADQSQRPSDWHTEQQDG